jgi:hypothetical protein
VIGNRGFGLWGDRISQLIPAYIQKAGVLFKADQGELVRRKKSVARSTPVTVVARIREKLVSECLDAVFARKKRETPPIEADL